MKRTLSPPAPEQAWRKNGAWYGGRGPGVLAALVSSSGVLYFFVPPLHSFELSPDHASSYFIFIALCLLLVEFGARRRSTERARVAGKRGGRPGSECGAAGGGRQERAPGS